MSDDRPVEGGRPVDGEPPLGTGGPSDPTEARLVGAMAAFAGGVRPDPGGWEQIDGRLEAAPARRFARPGAATANGSSRRPLLVAAAFVVVLLVAGAVAVRARTGGTELEVATAPSEQPELAIVAVTEDGRLVELGTDGTERREIYRPQIGQEPGGGLTGPIAVSEADGVVYAERASAGLCGETADLAMFGEIVAIPIDGGDVRVVAAQGERPTYLPERNWLAYVAPADGQTCSSTLDAPMVDVVDLSTNDRGSFAVSQGMGSESADVAARLEGSAPVMSSTVLDLRWSTGGSSLFALVQLSRRSVPAFVDRLGFEGDVGAVATRDQTSNLGLILPDGPMPAGSALYAETLAPDGGEDRFIVAGVVDNYVRLPDGQEVASTDGRIRIYDTALQPRDGDPIGTDVDLEAPAVGGGSPVMLGSLDRDPATGRLLLLYTGFGPVSRTPDGTDVVAAGAIDGSGFTSRLLVWDGDTPTEIGQGYLAAAWFRRSGPVPPAATDTPIGDQGVGTAPPQTTTSIAIIPPGSTWLPTVPVPTVPTTEAPTDRLDDRAAIADTFRAFFEQGDQSALEGSGALAPALDEGSKSVENGGKGVTVTIDAVTFTGEGSAEVQFRLDQNGNYFTAATLGSAVFLDGRWKVSAATMCTLLSRVQIACPATG